MHTHTRSHTSALHYSLHYINSRTRAYRYASHISPHTVQAPLQGGIMLRHALARLSDTHFSRFLDSTFCFVCIRSHIVTVDTSSRSPTRSLTRTRTRPMHPTADDAPQRFIARSRAVTHRLLSRSICRPALRLESKPCLTSRAAASSRLTTDTIHRLDPHSSRTRTRTRYARTCVVLLHTTA